MEIAKKLGLDVEPFCRMIMTTKMLFSNVLGHAAELHYEKYLENKGIKFQKAPTDEHYDYLVNGKKEQVKRFETDSTNEKFIGVNLTQTHGNRTGQDAFYNKNSFDNLVLCNVDLKNIKIISSQEIPTNKKYPTHLVGKCKFHRTKYDNLKEFDKEFLQTLKFKNSEFPEAIEKLRNKYKFSYKELLEKCSNLTLKGIDSLFSEENFRLITGVKGFAAEEHFNVFLDKRKIPYKQEKEMYSKVDHWVGDKKIRVQVKTPHQRSVDENNWAFKTHKSHGHGVKELYKADMFDVIALFVGFEIDESKSRYFPASVKEEFVFIPVSDLERHPNYPEYLKRVTKIPKCRYNINDIKIFDKV